MFNLVQRTKNIIEVEMSGVVTKDDYLALRPQMESILARQGKSKFLFDLTGVKKFTAGAIWEDIKSDLANIRYIGSTAIVANRRIYEVLCKVVNAVFPEKIKHFDDKRAALAWVKAN